MELHRLYPNEKQEFRGQRKISLQAFSLYKDMCEKDFLIQCIEKLPIEKLKELVCFETINPFDGKVPESYEESEYKDTLRNQRVVEFRCSIII